MKSIRFIPFILLSFIITSSAFADDTLLSGTPIGSKYSYDPVSGRQTTSSYTFANAFDGKPDSFFSAWDQSMAWAGLDLGTTHVITRIGFRPQTGNSGPNKMLLGVFEGANSEDFMDALPLYLIDEAPQANTMTYADVNVSRGFRYVRYVGPANQRCIVSELEFYGTEGEGDDSQLYQVTNIPTLSVHVQDNILPKNRGEDFESRSQMIYDDGKLLQDYPILFRVRGNYSASPENKAYRIKFNDGKAHHMLKDGVNESPVKAKKWVLINSLRDKTLMRNPVGWEVSRRAGLNWTPWYQVVDLLVNGEYRGTYTLADHVSVHKGRIDITEMTADDISGEALTGGYYVEVDNNASREPYWFTSSHGNPITVHDPDDDVIQDVQFKYIRNAWNAMEDHVYNDGSSSEVDGFGRVLDLESFLRYFLASEYNGNTDMLCQVFFYKERGDDHFYTGPVWDHELALDDDITTFPANEYEGWTYPVRCTGNFTQFVHLVVSDNNVMARLQAMWAELRDEKKFVPDEIAACVDSLRQQISASARLNFIRWPYLNQYISLTPAIRGTWDAEVDVVRDYVYGRVAWMDRKLGYGQLYTDKDGVYQINTPLDVLTFAKSVNSGDLIDTCRVQLNADLDMEPFNARFQPVGTTAKPFCGTFDGQGHTISNLRVEGERNVGFFGVLGDGAVVKGLNIDSSCSFSGKEYVGAVAGRAQMGTVTIDACLNEAPVSAQAKAGAMLGGALRVTLTVSACANLGTVSADSEAAIFVGNASAKPVTVEDCWNTALVTGAAEGRELASATDLTVINCFDLHYAGASAKAFTEAQMPTGELCYALNRRSATAPWRQNIDNGRPRDPHPYATGRRGFVFHREDDTYTNSNPNRKGYRYYKLDISEIAGTGIIQLSEFDLLDDQGNEIEGITVYRGIESTISHENWPNIADDNTGTKFCSHFNGRSWFLFDAGQETPACGYRLWTANDTQSYSDRNPVSWTLSVSETYTENPDDDCWQIVDEREHDNTLQAANYTPYDFDIIDTGISDQIVNSKSSNSKWFDLTGRPVGTPTAKGLYILNGRKILIK